MSTPETIEIPALFSIRLFARWADMDFNQHMRNAAYLGAAEDCRMRFLADRGFTMAELHKRQLGPVVLEDRIVYKKELKLLEAFRVELGLAAITRDGKRMKLRNTFYRDTDAALCAVVDSVVIWLDLATRTPVVPPEELKSAWFGLARTSDFEWFE
jgi:acyl-CoA thioester hydrolase